MTSPLSLMSIRLFTFAVYDPRVNCNLASRRQVPLKAAFAMTVHKAQGMTLDCVAVDCHLINRPGQLGVAIGRATSLTRLQLTNFNAASCRVKQPDSVYEFYATSCSQPLADDRSCCKTYIPCSEDDNNRVEEDRNEGDIGEDDNGGDDFLSFNDQGMEELDDALQNVSVETTTLPNDFEVSTFVQSLKYENIKTTFQSVVNCHLDSLSTHNSNGLVHFICKHWIMVDNILSAKPSTAHAGHSQMYLHTVSPAYKCDCEQLFQTSSGKLTAEQWHVAFLVCTGVREVVVQRCADDVTTRRPSINGK